jgi:outer membrane immunogenic protein
LKELLATTALCTLPFTVSAADLPSEMPVGAPVVVAASDWTGTYIGLHAGYGWGASATSIAPGDGWVGDLDWGNVNAASTNSLRTSGILGGAQVGQNQQYNNVLLGIEADFSYFGMKESANSGAIASIETEGSGTFSVNTETKVNWVSTIRPRIGWATDATLLYLTGGLAIADVGFGQSIDFTNNNCCSDSFLPIAVNGGANAGSVSKIALGWALGVGGEYSFDRNWSLKAEYLHIDLGSQSFRSTFVSDDSVTYSITHKQDVALDTVWLGLNRRF